MKSLALLAASAAVVATFAAAAPAEAAQNLVYIAGRTQAAGWDGAMYSQSGYTTQKLVYNSTTATLPQAGESVTAQLRSWCSGGNTCIIVAYSNGAHILGYNMAYHPDALTGMTFAQTGGAAWGGSELLDGWTGSLASVFGALYDPGVDTYLHVTAARAGSTYNHNLTAGGMIYEVAGNTNIWNAALGSAFISGDDDGVVGYQSAFGCTGSGAQVYSCAKWANRTNSCHYASSYCANGACSGSTFSSGTDHFGVDDKAAYCF